MTDDKTPKVLKWGGEKIYRCRLCDFDSLDRKKFEQHFAERHPPFQIIDGSKDEPDDDTSQVDPTSGKEGKNNGR